jgi:predicted nucleotidyltransferase
VIDRLIARIARSLDNEKVPYMIIGGQAVLLYGRPRLTRDIDITLGVDTGRFEAAARVCADSGLEIRPAKPEAFAAETGVLPAQDVASRMRVNFIFSFTPYEQQALRRTRQVDLGGYAVRFASCEDVIVHKMVAGRAIDEEDVKSMLLKNKDSLDCQYIRKWLAEFGKISEYSEVLRRFEDLLKLI